MIDYVHGVFKEHCKMMTPIGVIRSEVILSYTPPNTTAALVVPPDMQTDVDNHMRRLFNRGLDPRFTAAHPAAGEQTVSFMPLPPGRVAMVLDCGFRHGNRFIATFRVYEKSYGGQLRREMWLVDAQPLTQAVA